MTKEADGWNRVSRGDWLGDPANFKEPAYCLDFDVERTGHVTLTVHKHDRISKMAEVVDNLFVFGVDFEAILDILEDDEALEDQFTTTASDVSKKR